MIRVDAMGDACPIPVVKTLQAIRALQGEETVEVLVDNETAVENLSRMAKEKGFPARSEKNGENAYRVEIDAKPNAEEQAPTAEEEAANYCDIPLRKQQTLVVISSEFVGSGDDVLGAVLMKSFIYALAQQEELPSCILFYNGGAKLTTEESPMLEDLRSMASQGVEILTCGTCLNHYGIADKLKIGGITNMYTIVEKMSQADRIVKP